MSRRAIGSIRLQWGRGFVAAEALLVPGTRHRPLDASMGPRLCSRGGVVEVNQTSSSKTASMGPRLCSRGGMEYPARDMVSRDSFNGAAAL